MILVATILVGLFVALILLAIEHHDTFSMPNNFNPEKSDPKIYDADDCLKPGETHIYDKKGRLIATNRGLVGQGGGGGDIWTPGDCDNYINRNNNINQSTAVSQKEWRKMSNDICEKLHISAYQPVSSQAASEIYRLRDENKILRDALEPFAAKDCALGNDNIVYSNISFRVKDIRRARAALEGVTPPAALWQHKKTGGIYEIIGYCYIENQNKPGVLYRNISTGVTWMRPKEEFFDGRFEKIKEE